MNGNGSAWDRGFFRFVRYVAVIGGCCWYMFRWEYKTTTLQGSVDSLSVRVDRLAIAALTRDEYHRVLRQANEEHRRMWSAMGRPAEARELDPR
jgi:hypothetical protein